MEFTAAMEGNVWCPTLALAFVPILSGGIRHGAAATAIANAEMKMVLHQKWVAMNGEYEWRPVPTLAADALRSPERDFAAIRQDIKVG